MSIGNGGAAIGLSNDNKLTVIGELVVNATDPRAGTSSYVGNDVTNTWWTANVLSEDVGFLIPSSNTDKYLFWVTTGSSPVTLGAESRVAVVDGVITADDAGDYTVFFAAGTVIPTGVYLWVESFAEILPIEYDEGDPIPDQEPIIDVPFELDISAHFTGGPPPKVYEIFSGSLPPGLALNGTSGIVSGTPTTLGSSGSVVFKARDGRGNSSNSSGIPFTVVPAVVPPNTITGNTVWWLLDQPSTRTWNSIRSIPVVLDASVVQWWEPPPDAAANRIVLWENNVIGIGNLELAEVNGLNVVRFGVGASSRIALYKTFRKSDNADLGQLLTSALVSAGGKTIVMAINITSTTGTGSNPYANAPILGDDANRFQIGCQTLDAGNVNVRPYNYDGTEDSVLLSVPKASWGIISVRHNGTTLQIRRNRGSWASVASGATSGMTGFAYVGQQSVPGITQFMLAGQAFFNTALSDADLAAVEDYYANAIGVTLP